MTLKTKYKVLFGILAVIACMLFGCEKREKVLLAELSDPQEQEETAQEQAMQTAETVQEPSAQSQPAKGETLAEETETPPEEAVLVVHICGAVRKPGVYELPKGSRLYQAVEAAGGFLEEADADFLNQAETLEDGSRIRIPTKEEAEEALSLGEGQPFITGGEDSGGGGSGQTDGLVNINTAAKEELCTITGIGSSRAESIIKYRTENGNFHTVEEIMNVEGIKDGLFEKIKDRITV